MPLWHKKLLERPGEPSVEFPRHISKHRPKRDEVTGSSRKLHNEEFHKLYSSPSIIRLMKSRR
jgi:hypothetical protein